MPDSSRCQYQRERQKDVWQKMEIHQHSSFATHFFAGYPWPSIAPLTDEELGMVPTATGKRMSWDGVPGPQRRTEGSGCFDSAVIVMGGGPGGCAAAITCAAMGLRVLLLERNAVPVDRPGETLHPGVESVLSQLGLADRLHLVVGSRHAGIQIEWGKVSRFESYGEDGRGNGSVSRSGERILTQCYWNEREKLVSRFSNRALSGKC